MITHPGWSSSGGRGREKVSSSKPPTSGGGGREKVSSSKPPTSGGGGTEQLSSLWIWFRFIKKRIID